MHSSDRDIKKRKFIKKHHLLFLNIIKECGSLSFDSNSSWKEIINYARIELDYSSKTVPLDIARVLKNAFEKENPFLLTHKIKKLYSITEMEEAYLAGLNEAILNPKNHRNFQDWLNN